MIKAVLFDWDRTLADTLWLKAKLARRLCKKYNINYLSLLANLKKLCGKTTFQIIRHLGKQENASNIIEDYKLLYEKYAGKVKLFDKTILSDLKKQDISVGIVTNDIKENTILTCERLGQKYDVLVSYQDVKNPKPNPEPLLLALKQIGVAPSEAVYVGDHPQDMIAAKAAGMVAVGKASFFSSAKKLKAAGADYVIKNIRDAVKIISLEKKKNSVRSA